MRVNTERVYRIVLMPPWESYNTPSIYLIHYGCLISKKVYLRLAQISRRTFFLATVALCYLKVKLTLPASYDPLGSLL